MLWTDLWLKIWSAGTTEHLLHPRHKVERQSVVDQSRPKEGPFTVTLLVFYRMILAHCKLSVVYILTSPALLFSAVK